MRVRSIDCSNALSFKRAEDLDNKTTIEFFSSQSHEGGLHLLIGPNGSGKTNFMHILRTVLTELIMLPCEYLPNYRTDPDNKNRTLLLRHPQTGINPHRATPDKPQHLQLELLLTEIDIDNMRHLWEQRAAIDQIINTYSTIREVEPTQRDKPKGNKAARTVRLDIAGKELTRNCNIKGDCSRLVHDYIRYFHLLQYCLEILQTDEHTPHPPSLQETITTIPADRAYRVTTDMFDTPASQLDQQINAVHRELIELLQLDIPIYRTVKARLQTTYQELREQNNTKEEALQELEQLDRLVDLNHDLAKIIHYRLVCSIKNEQIICRFQDIYADKLQKLRDLGGGEQTITHFLFELHARGLQESIMIIEEPELHVHPHLQQKFLRLLQRTAKEHGMQYIITTHSPFFVTHETITNLIRFQKHHHDEISYTAVYQPKQLSIKEKNLIKALDYNVAGNIFFVDKAIMVEGPDDHYFFEHFIADRGSGHPDQPDIRHFGIFQLNGKHMFPQFKTFLAQYGLATYYIGDRDNIGNILHIDYYPYREAYKEAHQLPDRTQLKHHYEALVKYIHTNHPETYEHIISKIDNLWNYQIFILKQGSIESYVDTDKKGLDQMIEFCKEDFQARKSDPEFAQKRGELTSILREIFLD